MSTLGKIQQTHQQGLYYNKRIQFLFICILVFIIYSPIINFQFIGLDDQLLIVDNYKFIKNPGNIFQAFKQDVFHIQNQQSSATYYRPLFTLSLMFDAQLGKTSPAFYHFSNIVFHILSCWLIFKLLLQLKIKSETVFILTLLFAVHPTLTQAVAWIPGRNDSLITIFIVASFIFFLRFLESPGKKDLFFHLLFLTGALFTKEIAVVFIPLCLIYIIYIKNDKLFSTAKLQLLLYYLIITLIWFFLRKAVVDGSKADLSFSSLSHNFFNNLPLLIQYIGKLIFPINLSVMPSFGNNIYLIIYTIAILLIGISIYYSKNKRWNYIFFGIIWFISFLLPTFLVPILTGFEHRIYLPMIGFLILLGEVEILKTDFLKNKKYLSVGLGIVILFVVITVNHSFAFKDKISF